MERDPRRWLTLGAGYEAEHDTTGFTQSDDNNWWYRNDAEFVRPYGEMNPNEDFATTFAAYMMVQTNRNYQGDPDGSNAALAARMDGKFDVLDSFFASLQ